MVQIKVDERRPLRMQTFPLIIILRSSKVLIHSSGLEYAEGLHKMNKRQRNRSTNIQEKVQVMELQSREGGWVL